MKKSKSMRERFKSRWMRASVGTALVLCVGIASLVAYVIFFDAPFNRVRYQLLTDPSYLDNAQIISQTQEVVFVDEFDTMHVKIPIERAKTMVTKNILQSCEDSHAKCTNPIWQPYSNFHKVTYDQDVIVTDHEFGIPYPSDDSDEKNVQCASIWDESNGIKDAATSICIDVTTGDLWYELNII